MFDGLAVGEGSEDLVDFKPNEIQVGEKLRFFGDGYTLNGHHFHWEE